jgi:uridine monophosphate synthetase
VVSSADSKLDGIKSLEELGGKVEMVLVVVDREQGGKEKLEVLGYEFYALATISEITEALLYSKYITEEDARKILDYIKG